MFKIVIADDEVKVCRLIQNVIDWKSLDAEIVGIAHDGIRALEIIQNEEPDIVITDIRMPGYDGIQLIEKAKKISPKSRFIIVSGYRQFDYAHNAIKFGVEDYLLKPLKEEELLEIITKMLEKKKQSREIQNRKEYMQRRIETDTKKIKQGFMEFLIKSPQKLDEKLEIDKVNKEYYCQFKPGIFQVLVVKPDIPVRKDNQEAYNILINRVQRIATAELEENSIELLSCIVGEGVYFLINMDREYEKELRKKLKKIRTSISGLRDLFWDIQATVGLGIQTEDFSQIKESARKARESIFNRIFLGTGQIIEAGKMKQGSISAKDIVDNNTKIYMLERMEVLDIEELKKILKQMQRIIVKQKNMQGELVLKICEDIIDILLFSLKNVNAEIDAKRIREEFMIQFHMCVNVEQVFQQLENMFETSIRNVIASKEQRETKPIRIAKKYIQDNFHQSLKLEQISNMVGFNPTYFSSLFKKETGKNFSEYLVQVRVNKAKQLLADEDISVVEIAEQVGYTDLKYFSKIFKKSTGLNPSEFRKLYRKLY